MKCTKAKTMEKAKKVMMTKEEYYHLQPEPEPETKPPGPAEAFIRKKYGIQIMPNELTFFHEKLFEMMEEFAAEQMDEVLAKIDRWENQNPE